MKNPIVAVLLIGTILFIAIMWAIDSGLIL